MAIEFVTETVILQVSGRVATVELNRPESLNSLNVDMLKGLAATLKEISTLDEIDLVVLKGNGRAFSSGGDIKTMLAADNTRFPEIMEMISNIVHSLYTLPKLTIAAVSGAAAGLGLSIALATDYIIADKSSKLAMNFIGVGLIPDGGGHYFLEKRLGEDKAKHVIWEGKPLSAEEAYSLGLVNEIVEGELSSAIDAKLQRWLNSPIKAMIETKKIFADKNSPQLAKVLQAEKESQYKMRQTEDHQEGVQAFIEKRRPNFKGK